MDEFEERLRQNMEHAIAFELRVQRLSTVIVVRLSLSFFFHIFLT